MASKKDFSFLEILKIINKFSQNKINIFVKTIEEQKKNQKKFCMKIDLKKFYLMKILKKYKKIIIKK